MAIMQHAACMQNRIEEWIKEWRLNPQESRDLYLETAALLRTNKVLALHALHFIRIVVCVRRW